MKAVMTVLLLSLLTGAVGSAQAFELDWFTVDGGGEMFSTGAGFELSGTIGQPDVGVMTGGALEVVGGFWAVSASAPAPCPGDLDGDNEVNINDLTVLLANFGDPGPNSPGDADGDGDTDVNDLTILLANFGVACA